MRRGAKRQLELEAGVGIVERRAELLAQAGEAVADGLCVHVQLARYLGDVALVAEPGQQGRLQARASRGRQRGERFQARDRELAQDRRVAVQCQRPEALAGDDQRSRGERAVGARRTQAAARAQERAASAHSVVGPIAAVRPSSAAAIRPSRPGASGSAISTQTNPSIRAPIAPSPTIAAKRSASRCSAAIAASVRGSGQSAAAARDCGLGGVGLRGDQLAPSP